MPQTLPRRHRLMALLALAALGLALALGVWWRLRSAGEPLMPSDHASVTVVAGDGVPGLRDGPAHAARFSDPFGVAVAADGTIYVADAGRAQRIRRIDPAGSVSTLAGDGSAGHRDGPASTARFDTPSGLALDAEGGVLVADTGNHLIRRIGPDGVVTTIAGDGVAGFRDGPAREARFRGPAAIAVDPDGRIIVADTYNDRIRAIDPGGTVVTIAGSGRLGWADGPALAAEFDTPSGVAVDAASNIYVADHGNVAIRRIAPDGSVTTISIGGLVRPVSVAVNPDGVIYAAGDDRVVEVGSGGGARVIAGPVPGEVGGSGSGAAAGLRELGAIALGAHGELIAADAVNALVHRIGFVPPRELLPPSPLIRPAFDGDAFGHLPLLWPFAPQAGPFEVTATFGEPRGGITNRRLHAGIDIASPEGTDVLAVRDAVVTSLDAVTAFDTIYEAVRIGPVGYVHLRVGRDRRGRPFDPDRFVASLDVAGRLARIRVPRGTRFRSGERIGTLNAYNHAHLNVGWAGEEENPLRFRLPRFRDTTPPVIAAGGIRLFGEDGEPIARPARGRLAVGGRVEVVVDAWDQVDGNAARRRLGVYSVGYQVLHPDESPADSFDTPRRTLVFDRVPSSEAAALVFAPGSGIPGQGARESRFLYRATNTFRNGVAARGIWDTRLLRPGDYTLRIWVADIAGNVARRNRDVQVEIRNADEPAGAAKR